MPIPAHSNTAGSRHQLYPALVAAGHEVVCASRDPNAAPSACAANGSRVA